MEIVTPLLSAVQTFFSALNPEQFGFSMLDIVIVGVLIFYAYEGYILGFTLAFVDLLSFIFSFLLALVLYSFLGGVIQSVFSLAPGFSNAISFFVIALISEIILNILLRRLILFLPKPNERSKLHKIYDKVDNPMGIVPGIISAGIIISFLLTVIIALPTSTYLKEQVLKSRLGHSFVTQTSSLESSLKDVFGGAVQDTLNVITIRPESDATVDLKFTVSDPTIDEQSEQEMLVLVNQERVKNGLQPVVLDEELQILARDYAKDMFQRGYFSHYNPEGQSPFDRMNQYGITYIHAGENLALAPSVQMSHQGLMKSPGHRANILSGDYGKVGIGVMDGGIYGKMFVQEFTN